MPGHKPVVVAGHTQLSSLIWLWHFAPAAHCPHKRCPRACSLHKRCPDYPSLSKWPLATHSLATCAPPSETPHVFRERDSYGGPPLLSPSPTVAPFLSCRPRPPPTFSLLWCSVHQPVVHCSLAPQSVCTQPTLVLCQELTPTLVFTPLFPHTSGLFLFSTFSLHLFAFAKIRPKSHPHFHSFGFSSPPRPQIAGHHPTATASRAHL